MMNCGDKLPGRPSMGSWLTYGLGTENQNLPGFVVLCPGLPVVGPQLWTSAFLPAVYQGTYIPNNEKTPDKLMQYIRNTGVRALPEQRRQLDLLAKLNRAADAARWPRPAAGSQYPIGGDRLSHADRSAGGVRYHAREPEAVRARYGDGDFGAAA